MIIKAIDFLPNGFVSVCGVRIGITKKQAKDILATNGFEVIETQRSVYIKNVVFEKDLPPVRNVVFGIDDTHHVSYIRIVTKPSDKVEATRFYERFLSATKEFDIAVVYKDKWLTENETIATHYSNSINNVLVACSFVTRKWTGEIDPTTSQATFSVRSLIDVDSDVKSIKTKYYNLLDDISKKRKPLEKKSKLHNIYENNKGTIFVGACFLWVFLGIIGIFLYDSCSKNARSPEINTVYSADQPITERDAVYICTSPNAKKYHSTPSCRWLENCSGDIEKVSLSDAEAQKNVKGIWLSKL